MPGILRWITSGFVVVAVLGTAAEAVAARKGTRNYQPGDATSIDSPDRQTATAKGTQAFDACIATWDADTHMTKEEWRESCERVIKERASQPGT